VPFRSFSEGGASRLAVGCSAVIEALTMSHPKRDYKEVFC